MPCFALMDRLGPSTQNSSWYATYVNHASLLLCCSLLDSLPDIDLAAHLPALLPGLLGMLSDGNAEVRSACTKLLQARLGGRGWATCC